MIYFHIEFKSQEFKNIEEPFLGGLMYKLFQML